MGLCLGSLAIGTPEDTEATATSAATAVTSSSKVVEFPSSSNAEKSQFSEEASGISMDNSYPDGKILEAPKLKEFSFTDLKAATENFKSDSVLGEGGFGKVFKGWVDEKTLAPFNSCTGMAVAIKKWNPERMQVGSKFSGKTIPSQPGQAIGILLGG